MPCVVSIGQLCKAVERVGLHVYVAHVDIHRECVVAGCNLIATEHGRHGRYGLPYMQKSVE